jgi:L-threonylcarbamoyladenylate synthase
MRHLPLQRLLKSHKTNAFHQVEDHKFSCLNLSVVPIAGPYFQTRSFTMTIDDSSPQRYDTKILQVDATDIGKITLNTKSESFQEDWNIELAGSEGARNLQLAASQLRDSDVPIAFPTETVYGLGADATRSNAVRGIFRAKQRPADNPLIVHFASVKQLRKLLTRSGSIPNNGIDPIPAIYKPLMQRFWPGPLTIILPNPPNSGLAPEVTAGLKTFGARIPRNILALALIKLADVPVAAPSANASTKPSPTASEHVKDDLDGRIEYILDGGPCDVGVESTVVDGLSCPPTILRPGGISIEQLRECVGWENTRAGYMDRAEREGVPRAPGMKYRHYSPSAKVVLFEAGTLPPGWNDVFVGGVGMSVGFVTTKTWETACDLLVRAEHRNGNYPHVRSPEDIQICTNGSHDPNFSPLPSFISQPVSKSHNLDLLHPETKIKVTAWAVNLGGNTKDIARGLFSALRELDRNNVSTIFVEGVEDGGGDVAAAIMNRLRKAAETNVR